MNIIFAKTRWVYDSYVDLWSLVKLAGFPTCFVDEMETYNPDNMYITAPFNGELLDFMNEDRRKGRKAEIVLWNLERPGGSGSIEQYKQSNEFHIECGHISKVIVSDKQLARDTGFQYITLGSHPLLGHPEMLHNKAYDIIHLMCYSYRRGSWFEYPGHARDFVKASDCNISVAPNCWGVERHLALQQSRFMLSIHQDEFPYIEPLRFALAAAYGLPLISEYCTDYYPYVDCVKTGVDDVIFNAARVVKEYLRNDYWYTQGLQLRALMTEELNFRACIERQL